MVLSRHHLYNPSPPFPCRMAHFDYTVHRTESVYMVMELKYADYWGLPWWLNGKEFACNVGDAGDTGLILESGRSPGGGCGNPFQYFYLENPMHRGAWLAIVHGVTKSWTWQKWLNTHADINFLLSVMILNSEEKLQFGPQRSTAGLINLAEGGHRCCVKWLLEFFCYLQVGE